MAGKTITMSKIKQVIRLRRNGLPLQTIAEAVEASRNTVKKYIRLIEARQLNEDLLLLMDDEALEALLNGPLVDDDAARVKTLTGLFPHFERELGRVGVTRWVLWGEYRQQHPDGYSYSRFCDYYAQWHQSRSATMHMEHEPGDKLFIDFTGKKLSIVDASTGEVTDVEVYVCILGYSQLTYVEAIVSQKRDDFIRATENALHFYGGVTKVLVPDNLKSAVHKADKYEAEINNAFQDFANHYQTAVLPARSYKPRDKALVEKAVSIVYSRIFAPLRNKVFHSLASLNEAIKELLAQHNNQFFRDRPISRLQLFEQQEKTYLTPLPVSRYELKYFKEATVMKSGYVQIYEDRHCYSVPYRYIGRKVKIIYSVSQVAIYYNREQIAYHRRSFQRLGFTTVHEHMHSSNQFVAEWNPEKFLRWAGAIAPVVQDYIAKLLEIASYPEQAYRGCVGILSFDKKYGRERFIKAIERAIHYEAYSYTVVKKILQNGLDRILSDEEHSQPPQTPPHDNIRGPEAYQ
jgi:transposase